MISITELLTASRIASILGFTPVPRFIKVTKTYTDFATAAFTNDIEIYSLPARSVLRVVIDEVTTPFSGGTIATYTISKGKAGSLALFSAAFDVKTNVVNFQIIEDLFINDTGSAISIRAAAISTVGLLNAATQGSISFHLEVSTLQ